MIDIEKLQERIDAYSASQPAEEYTVKIPADKGRRKYLGMSALASDCLRAEWMKFRHAVLDTFPPRMLRLFRRGHREEYVFIILLRAAGLTVYDVDKNGEQFEVKDFEGHLSGHCDGFLVDETGELFLPKFRDKWTKKPFLAEYKSYNLKRFKELQKKGVAVSDPKYYGQMQLYMAYFGVDACLFCAVCKDDDHLEFQWIKRDKRSFAVLHDKADKVINRQEPPPKISSTGSHYKCRYCAVLGVCQKNKPADKNCRSCKFAVPTKNAKWKCLKKQTFGTVCKLYKDITK